MRLHRTGRAKSLCGAVTLVIAGMALPAGAANLLINPGFENPVDNQPTDHTATGWTFTNPTVLRSNAYNNTPGGTYSVWEQVWQPGGGGINQTAGYASAAVEFNVSCSYYFEPNFALDTGTTVDLGLTWLDASNNAISRNFQYIASNSAPLSTWTRYSLSAVAPIGATQVRVSFDYSNPNGANAGGAQSAYVDDADLEFAERTGPSTWTSSASGDWNNGINWSLGHGPNGINTIANFAGAISSATTVYTDIPVTVGELVFNNPNEYVIGGAGSLTLNESGPSAAVEVDQGTQKLDLPVTIASNTVLDVASGATLIVGNPLTIDAGMSLTQSGGGTVAYESIVAVGAGRSISFGNTLVAGGLSVPSGTTAYISGSDSLLTVDSLSISGILDVGKNRLVINSATSATIDSVESQLRRGYAGGKWNGPGLDSSAAARSGGRYGVGWTVGDASGAGGDQIKIEYALYGDANLDGVVDGLDLSILEANFGKQASAWDQGDFNYTSAVDSSDFRLLAENFGMRTDGTRVALPSSDWAALDAFAAANGLMADVPEPDYAYFVVLGMFVAQKKRRLW